MDVAKYGFVVARAPSVEVVDWSAFDSDEMAAGLARLCGDVLSKMTGVKVECDDDRLRSGAIYLNLTDNLIGLHLYFEKSRSGVPTAVGIVTGHKQRRTVEVKEASKTGYADALVAVVKQIVAVVYDDWVNDAEKKIKVIRSVERFS